MIETKNAIVLNFDVVKKLSRDLTNSQLCELIDWALDSIDNKDLPLPSDPMILELINNSEQWLRYE